MTTGEGIWTARRRFTRQEPSAAAARSGAREPFGLAGWIIVGYLIVEYGRPQYYFPPLGYLKAGLWLVLLGLYVLLIKRPHPLPREGKAVAAFLVLMAAGVPFSESPRITLDITQTMTQMMVAGPFLMMVGLDSVDRLTRVLRVYVLLAAIQAVQGITHAGHGIGGYFVDENDLATLGSTAIPIAYFLGVTATSLRGRLLAFGAFTLCILGIIVSFSRGGFLALCAAALYTILRSRRPVATLFAVFLSLAVIFPFIPPKWYSEMGTIETATQKGDTGEMRLYMWGVARRVFYDHPVMGVGAANFGRVAQDYQDPEQAWDRGLYLYGYACHSLYFTMLAEMGLTGAAVFVALLFFAYSTTTRVSRQTKLRMEELARDGPSPELGRLRALFGACRGLEGGMIGFLVSAAFLTVNYYPECWSLAGLMAATGLAFDNDSVLTHAHS